MIETTVAKIESGAESLRKLANIAKMPPTLFIRFANAWRDAKDQLESMQMVQAASIDEHTHFVDAPLPDGTTTKIEQFIDKEHKRAHLECMRQLRDTKVELPRAKPIEWKAIEDAKIDITPFDAASLDWLIEFPED